MNEVLPQVKLEQPFDKKYYPNYKTDTCIEVMFCRGKVGHNVSYYGVSYKAPFFCVASDDIEELYSKITSLLDFWYTEMVKV